MWWVVEKRRLKRRMKMVDTLVGMDKSVVMNTLVVMKCLVV